MSEISKKIDAIIGMDLAPCLKSKGFKKKGRNFYRNDGKSIAVVNVQASAGNVGQAGRFTLNIGRYFPDVARIEGSPADLVFPKEYQCTVRRRIGGLLPERGDYWWEITDGTDTEEVAKEVWLFAERYALPWLDGNLAAPKAEFPNSMTAASIALFLNDKEGATRIASTLMETLPQDKARVVEWAMRNGVSLE